MCATQDRPYTCLLDAATTRVVGDPVADDAADVVTIIATYVTMIVLVCMQPARAAKATPAE